VSKPGKGRAESALPPSSDFPGHPGGRVSGSFEAAGPPGSAMTEISMGHRDLSPSCDEYDMNIYIYEYDMNMI